MVFCGVADKSLKCVREYSTLHFRLRHPNRCGRKSSFARNAESRRPLHVCGTNHTINGGLDGGGVVERA